MAFLLRAAGHIPGSRSLSKLAGQQGWGWLRRERVGGPLDREGRYFSPQGAPPCPQRSGKSLLPEPQFPHLFNGSTEKLGLLQALELGRVG